MRDQLEARDKELLIVIRETLKASKKKALEEQGNQSVIDKLLKKLK